MAQSSAGLVFSLTLASWVQMGGSGYGVPSMLMVEQGVRVGLGHLGFCGECVEQAVNEALANW